MAVTRIETVIVSIPVVAVLTFAGWQAYSTYVENEKVNAPARAAGFANADDMIQARNMGLSTEKDWRAELQRRAEQDRIAKKQAEVKAAMYRTEAEAQQAKIAAAEAAAKAVRQSQFQEGLIYARVLKKSMKNPDSFKLATVSVDASRRRS